MNFRLDNNGIKKLLSHLCYCNFNSDRHPHATLKAFNEFIEQYEFCYIARYPIPPKNSMYSVIEKRQSQNRNK